MLVSNKCFKRNRNNIILRLEIFNFLKIDAVLNHFVGAGNDLLDHRNPSAGCAQWSNKSSSAPVERQSPFYSHAYTYKYNQV